MPGYHKHQLGMATAAAPGGPWVRHGGALLPRGKEDDNHGNPTLLRSENNTVLFEEGMVTMLYCGNSNQSIFMATSTDGEVWKKVGGHIWTGYAPSVLRVDGLLHLYYVETTGPGYWSIGLARGADWQSLKRVGTVLTTNTPGIQV